MKLIEIIATVIILTSSIFIIYGVPNDQLDAIDIDFDDVAQVKSLLLDLSSRVQHLEKKNDDLTIQVQQFIESSEDHFDLLEENIDQIEKHINQSEESMIVFSVFIGNTLNYYDDGDDINGFDGFLAGNYGSSIDLASGIFTTPNPGIYEFSFAMYHSYKPPACIKIWKNDVEELSFYSYAEGNNSNDDTLSATWLMTLQKNDRIKLKAYGISGSHLFVCAPGQNCVFNGKYIRSI